MAEFFICVAIGLVAGASGGLFGIGGGIIITPLLVLLLQFEQHKAQGTSLLALSLPVLAIGAYTYYKDGNVDWRKGLMVALGMVGGAYLGSRIAINLDPVTMRRTFAVFLMVASIYLFVKK
jgi:hypothetical protein